MNKKHLDLTYLNDEALAERRRSKQRKAKSIRKNREGSKKYRDKRKHISGEDLYDDYSMFKKKHRKGYLPDEYDHRKTT